MFALKSLKIPISIVIGPSFGQVSVKFRFEFKYVILENVITRVVNVPVKEFKNMSELK